MSVSGIMRATGARERADGAAGSTPGQTSWRTHAIVAVLALAVSIGVLIYTTDAGSTEAKLNDFYREALPAYLALTHGHLLSFLRLGPTYVGSLVLRAPFAIIPSIWGGGSRALYFASALPCMIALAGFCTWLAAQPRRRGGVTWASRLSPVVICIVNPLTLIALFGGHPEEILGAVLCIGAVILAVKQRPALAGLLVGLAVVDKAWALVAVPVVFAVMPAPRRRGVFAFLATVALLLGPITLARVHGVAAGTSANVTGSSIGDIFTPPQLLWWFGPHAWIVQESRALIIAVAIGFAALWWVVRGRPSSPMPKLSEALLLLALVFLARAALDPWNNLYYHVPFLFALIAYEASAGRMPLLTVLYTILLLIVVPVSGVPHMSTDLRAASYAGVVVPTFGWLAARAYFPKRFSSAQLEEPEDRLSPSSSRSHSQPTDRSSTPIAAATLSHIP
jgi:hypothetical protein